MKPVANRRKKQNPERATERATTDEGAGSPAHIGEHNATRTQLSRALFSRAPRALATRRRLQFQRNRLLILKMARAESDTPVNPRVDLANGEIRLRCQRKIWDFNPRVTNSVAKSPSHAPIRHQHTKESNSGLVISRPSLATAT